MKRTKIDMTAERLVLAHCIVDDKFLEKIYTIGKPELFESNFARIVAGWIWDYFESTGRKAAPGRNIEEIYQTRKSECPDEEQLDLVQEFLSALSADWERAEIFSIEWSITQGLDYFRTRSLAKFQEKLERLTELKDLDGAEALLRNYEKIEIRPPTSVRIAQDVDQINDAFTNEDETVFTLPGALGELLGPIIAGDFCAFFAPMKRGKSYWLGQMGYSAMREGVKSLNISLEMTSRQTTRRNWLMVCGSPRQSKDVKIPYFTEDNRIDYDVRRMDAAPSSKAGIRRVHELLRRYCRGGEMITEVLPSGATTVSDIRSLLHRYKREGVAINLLNVDYADLLIPENPRLDGRHALDWIWKSLRGLAQEEEKLAIFTASQTAKMTLEHDAREKDAAEDVRKLAHVTKAIILNQSDIERKAGVMRIRSTMQRDIGPSSGEVVVLEQREIGRVLLDSRWRHDVVDDKIVGKWRESDG